MEKIVAKLEEADKAYYNSDKPVLTDAEYDRLKSDLRNLAPNHPQLSSVGAPIPEHLTKVKHEIQMLSLDNANDAEEYKKWHAKHNKPVIVMDKLDGSSIEIIYRGGEIHSAITRGDGIQGEMVVQNVKKFKNVPCKLTNDFSGSIRGEAMLLIADFKKHFTDTANPRNAANGTVRRKSGTNAEHLSFFAFDAKNGMTFKTHANKLEFVKTLGFDIVEYTVCLNADDAIKYHEKRADVRDKLDKEIDGLVCRINNEIEFEKMGIGHKRPKGARAFKFKAMGGVSVLEDVVWTVGHTGQVCPTARVTPINIGGTTVSNAFLNNPDEIERLGIQLGDEINVIKAGDVIPKITGLARKGNSRRPIPIPSKCPSCGHKTEIDGAHLWCRNENCDAQAFRKIRLIIEKLDIKFFGSSLREKLWESGEIKKPVDIYKLTESQIAEHTGGTTMAKKVKAEIDNKRTLPLHLFIGTLGIPFLGRRKAELMIQAGCNTLQKFRTKYWESNTVEGVGPEIETALTKGFADLSDEIDDLLKFVTVEDPKEIKKEGEKKMDHPYSEKTFCFTGFRMKEEVGRFYEVGAIEKSGVSKGLHYLVTKDTSSSSNKVNKARNLGVQVISVDEFKTTLNS